MLCVRLAYTAASLTATDWDRPHSRETGAFPVARLKYSPTVGRVDNVSG